jgi:hypothetical protein
MTNLNQILLYENFDGKSGQIEKYPGFSAADNTTIIDAGGGQAGATWIDNGATGWGDWGFAWEHPDLQKCEKGDEIWWRLMVYFPEDFKIQSEPGFMKGFRIGRVKKSNNDNRGYVDWYIGNDNKNQWRHIVEFEPNAPGHDSWHMYEDGDLKKGTAQLYEIYCYLHPVNGVMRMWCDGEMIGEETRPTIAGSSAESYVQRLLWTTYYNGGSPQKQWMSFDHFSVAVKNSGRDDSQHLSTDSHGNKHIGTDIQGGIVQPPAPPVDPVDPPVDPVDPPVDPVIPPPSLPPVIVPGAEVATMQVHENRVYVYSSLPVTVISSE